MVCKHDRHDATCSTYKARVRDARQFLTEVDKDEDLTPDAEKFRIVRCEAVVRPPHKWLILMVHYPNCPKCYHEGDKIMVFENVTPSDALLWTCIDPHFAGRQVARPRHASPSPIARFPGDEEGWHTAKFFVKGMGSV